MSNTRDNLIERNVEVNRPTSSVSSTSQSLRPKNAVNKKIKENKVISPSKEIKAKKQLPAKFKIQQGNAVPVQVYTNNNMSDISSQCQNLTISGDADETNSSQQNEQDRPESSRRKNAKKKERLKQSQPNSIQQTPTIPNSIAPNQQFGLSNSVQDFFRSHVTPLYTATSTRYLENLIHHPQFMHMNNSISLTQNVYYRNAPGTSGLQNGHMSNSMSTLHQAMSVPQPTATTYLENVSHHPLFNHSKSVDDSVRFRQTHGSSHALEKFNSISPLQDNATTSPSRTKRNKKKEIGKEETSYECHLSINEAETGLKNNIFIEGVLRINPKQFQHAYLSSNDRSEQDVFIEGLKNRNRALEGDIVVVQLLPESDNEDNRDDNKHKRGKVVHIKEKVHPRTCIGTLKLMADKNRQRALFVPRDNRIPRLNIPCTTWPDNFYREARNYENTLFLAKIEEWNDTRFAVGRIECNIGQSGDMKTETKAILAQTDLDITPFGPEVRSLFPSSDYVIPEDEIKRREDCRKHCIFSIDPFNCRDIDDAVSCIQLDNGNYEIGVHISDVAHYLTEDTVLDEKVADKATTIYLVERAYHMLPDELCMLCSLFPGVDKLAFSVFWEIDENAKVIKHRFAKTIIKSCCQLAYDHAQAILEDREDSSFPEIYNGFQYSDIYKVVKTLGKISSILRKNRYDEGALKIDQPKVAFHLSATNGLPDSFWIYESKESHQLIEEFMLLANMTVAKRIYEDHPKIAFLRCHPPPSGYMLKQLAKSLQPLGIEIEISSAGDLYRSLLPHIGPNCTDKGKAMVLNMLCAKPMTRAKYFCADGCDEDDFRHYALNTPFYTHFTSPIRRYADIMVHRLLAASLQYRDVPNWKSDKVRMVAAQCNKQKYNAKKAGELSTELYTLKYIEMNSPFYTEAVVVDIREKYIDVIVVAMYLNRRIFFNNDFPGQYKCVKNDAGIKLSKMELTWQATTDSPEVTQVIEVFSILQVELYKDDDMVKVETKLVRPKSTNN